MCVCVCVCVCVCMCVCVISQLDLQPAKQSSCYILPQIFNCRRRSRKI